MELIFTFETFFKEIATLIQVDRDGITRPLIHFWFRAFDVYSVLVEEVNKQEFLYGKYWQQGRA